MSKEQKKYKFKSGYTTSGRDVELFNKLIKAIEENDKESVQKLINEGIELNRYLFNLEEEKYETPLIVSIKKGYDEITLLLLESGAKVNLNSVFDTALRETPLNAAVSTGNYNITEELIKRKANLNVIVKCITPLSRALQKAIDSQNEIDKKKYYNIAKLLIINGANLEMWLGEMKDKEIILEEAYKLDSELGCKDLSLEIEKKEREEESRKQKLRREYIDRTKKEIQDDDKLECKFEHKTIE